MKPQNVFRAAEIFDMAIRIEKQGIAFYQACADSASDVKVQKVFEDLIDQEKTHIDIFSKMKEDYEDYRLPESYPGEMVSYINSFVQDQVFEDLSSGRGKGAEIKDPLNAINLGIEFEKRSILFYSGIKQAVRKSEKEAVESIIGEEHKHICQLLALRGKL
jgi:rubrerythrin